jgi:hypothetical protein
MLMGAPEGGKDEIVYGRTAKDTRDVVIRKWKGGLQDF